MIRIEHSDLVLIKDDYTNKVVDEIILKIKSINELLNLLQSINPIKEKYFNYKKANPEIKALLGNESCGRKSKKLLAVYLEQIRQNKSNYINRFNKFSLLVTTLSTTVLGDLISSEPDKLESIQFNILQTLTLNSNDLLISYLFSYHNFYDGFIKKIGPQLGINVCPYCNRNYITDVVNIKGKRIIGPTYDHFFNQKENPLLVLSFYNLIPSCYTCNSNLKGKKKFKFDTHLHPYYHEMGDSAVFDFKLDTSTTPIKNKIIFKPELNVLASINSPEYKRLEKTLDDDSGSINVFRLREIYESHGDILNEIHEKFDENSPFYLISLKKFITNLNSNEEEFYRFHFGNYYNTSDFNKRPLAKLTKDIYTKMKMIYKKNNTYRTK